MSNIKNFLFLIFNSNIYGLEYFSIVEFFFGFLLIISNLSNDQFLLLNQLIENSFLLFEVFEIEHEIDSLDFAAVMGHEMGFQFRLVVDVELPGHIGNEHGVVTRSHLTIFISEYLLSQSWISSICNFLQKLITTIRLIRQLKFNMLWKLSNSVQFLLLNREKLVIHPITQVFIIRSSISFAQSYAVMFIY